MTSAMHHNRRLTEADSPIADERVRRRAAQLASVLALTGDQQRGRQVPLPRTARASRHAAGTEGRSAQHAVTQQRAAARNREAKSNPNDTTRKNNARAQQQNEILQRIDDNLRRLRQLAETRSAALAVFTPPEH